MKVYKIVSMQCMYEKLKARFNYSVWMTTAEEVNLNQQDSELSFFNLDYAGNSLSTV